MDSSSSNGMSSSKYVKKGSVFPKKKEAVSTKVGKKVVELAEKAATSAYKKIQNNKAKVNP